MSQIFSISNPVIFGLGVCDQLLKKLILSVDHSTVQYENFKINALSMVAPS